MPRDEHGEYDAHALLDRLHPRRDLEYHRARSKGAATDARTGPLAAFVTTRRTEADYHAAAHAWLLARTWADESDFLDAIEAAIHGTGVA